MSHFECVDHVVHLLFLGIQSFIHLMVCSMAFLPPFLLEGDIEEIINAWISSFEFSFKECKFTQFRISLIGCRIFPFPLSLLRMKGIIFASKILLIPIPPLSLFLFF